MMEKSIDALLEQLGGVTCRLEQVVMFSESEPEEWMDLLDERENLVEQLQEIGLVASNLTELQRNELVQIDVINQRVVSFMERRKNGVQQQLNNLQRSKLAMNSYNEVGANGYGAFFDRKK